MAELKHIGRIKSTGRKVLVAFRTLPGESDSALVIQTENLTDDQHDSLIRLVESSAAQSSYEFAEVLARSQFSDGSIMLSKLHVTGRLVKVPTSEIEMLPNPHTSIVLSELNQLIAEQRGISINDLAIGNNSKVSEIATINEVPLPLVEAESQVANIPEPPLTDSDLALKYIRDADLLLLESTRLREMAKELLPKSVTPILPEEIETKVIPETEVPTVTIPPTPVVRKTAILKKQMAR